MIVHLVMAKSMAPVAEGIAALLHRRVGRRLDLELPLAHHLPWRLARTQPGTVVSHFDRGIVLITRLVPHAQPAKPGQFEDMPAGIAAPLRKVLDAILYVTRSGGAWRLLPLGDFPPWQTVYGYPQPARGAFIGVRWKI